MINEDISYIRQNDTSPTADIICLDADGAVVNVLDATVVFRMKSITDGTLKVEASGTVVNGEAGHVRYVWQTGDTDTVDRYNAEFELTFVDGSIETFRNGPNNLKVYITPELG